MLYNVPGRTGVDILAGTVQRIYNDCKNMYGIKEATGSLDRVIELQSLMPDLKILSGDDAIDFAMLTSGAAGITSVTANLLPDLKSKLVHDTLAGNLEEAKALSEKLYEINSIMFCEANPIPIKAAMYIAGLIDTLEYRLPLTQPSVENMKAIEKVMAKYDIVK